MAKKRLARYIRRRFGIPKEDDPTIPSAYKYRKFSMPLYSITDKVEEEAQKLRASIFFLHPFNARKLPPDILESMELVYGALKDINSIVSEITDELLYKENVVKRREALRQELDLAVSGIRNKARIKELREKFID